LIVFIVIPKQSIRGAPSLRCLNLAISCATLVCVLASIGCGTTTKRSGTEQLLISEAVDNAVAKLEFGELRGHKVFFDTAFLKSVRSDNFINQDYIVSAIRQQLTAAGALIQDTPAAISSSPVAALPEISLAQTNSQAGIAKVIVFAYDQHTKEPIWQSGVARAESDCSHTWVLGAGPFEKGSIYEGRRFAGKEIRGSDTDLIGLAARGATVGADNNASKNLSFRDAHIFQRSPEKDNSANVKLASAEEEIAEDQDASK